MAWESACSVRRRGVRTDVRGARSFARRLPAFGTIVLLIFRQLGLLIASNGLLSPKRTLHLPKATGQKPGETTSESVPAFPLRLRCP